MTLQNENWTSAGQFLDLPMPAEVSAAHTGRVKDYVQYCPVALASSVIAERWTPLIIRELVIGGRRFNEIDRGLPGISRTLLKQRLDYLERKGVVDRVEVAQGGHEYHLTPAGRDLEGVIMAVGEWAVRWMFSEPEPREVDPVTLTWWMSRRVVTEALPPDRTVLEFDYRGSDETRIWLVIERGRDLGVHRPARFRGRPRPDDRAGRPDAGVLRDHHLPRGAVERDPRRGRAAPPHPGTAALVRLEPVRTGRPRTAPRRRVSD